MILPLQTVLLNGIATQGLQPTRKVSLTESVIALSICNHFLVGQIDQKRKRRNTV